MLHVVDFRTSAGDTGEPDSPSIQPYNNGESADQTVLRRPPENNRARVEKLRQLVREHILLKDYNDGGVALYGGGTITVATGTSDLTVSPASTMYLVPFATPGGGGSDPWVASTKATLSVGTGVNELVFTSVQKQFEGATFPEADVNKISVEILDGGVSSPLTVVVEGATGEKNNIKITLDAAAHTLNNVIAAVTGHATASNFVVASLGGSAVGTNLCPLWGPAQWTNFEDRFLRGGAPGVAHEITSGGFTSFFTNPLNELQKGDTLAIAYDKVLNTTTKGGRVQSTIENVNVNVDLALFNTRREPEKIPNCIPICKRLDSDEVVFTNGATITTANPATLKFDSYGKTGAETGALATPLGWNRMGTGPTHNPPTTVRQALDNADGQVHAILNEVEAARSSATYGVQASLDARIEAHETSLLPSTRYSAFATADARLEFLEGLQTVVVSDGSTSTGGEYNGAAALKDAVIALEAAAGGTIVVRPGTYTWDVNQTISKPMRIYAAGGGSVTVTCTAAVTTYALTINGEADIRDLSFDGSLATGGAITLNSSNSRLTHVTCTSFNNAANIVHITGTYNRVDRLRVTSTTHTGNALRVEGSFGVYTSLDLQTRASAGAGITLFVLGTHNLFAGVTVTGDQVIFDSSGGVGTVWDGVYITTYQGTGSPNSNAVFSLLSAGGSLRSCTFDLLGTGGVTRILLQVETRSVAQAITMNCVSKVVQPSVPVLRVIDATVTDIRIYGFALPDATANGSTLSLAVPVIDVHTNGVLERFRVDTVTIQAGTANVECVVLGSSTSNTRGATFRGGEILLTGAVTSRGGSRILFGKLSTNTLIDDVDLDASNGEWATAVYVDADGVTVQNFRALLDAPWHSGAFDASLHAGDINGNFVYVIDSRSFVQIRGCRISGTAAPVLSGSPIAAFGSVGNAITYLTLTDNIIRTGTNMTTIVLDYVTGATIHGNIVSNGISTTGNTTFVPAVVANNNILV